MENTLQECLIKDYKKIKKNNVWKDLLLRDSTNESLNKLFWSNYEMDIYSDIFLNNKTIQNITTDLEEIDIIVKKYGLKAYVKIFAGWQCLSLQKISSI